MKDLLTEVITTPIALRVGERVQLVRWRRASDGEWRFDLVDGIYRERDRDWVTVVIDGDTRLFSRDEWDVCRLE